MVELEKSSESKEAWIIWTGVEPVFEILHGEERFLNLLEATGNPNLQKTKAAFYKTPKTAAVEKHETNDLPDEETNKSLSF